MNATVDGGALFSMDESTGHFIATIPAIAGAAIGLATMMIFTKMVQSKPVGSDHMKNLADKIHKGAVDFLITEYKFLAVFVAFIFVAVACLLINSEDKSSQNPTCIAAQNCKRNPIFGLWTAIPLLIGSGLSAFAGWRGMKIATQANVRTTAACDPAAGGSINEGLKVAFKSGAVMGLGVTGLGLLGIALM